MPVATFSERIGSALVNGSWFVRKLMPLAARIIVLDGYRDIDWIGVCGAIKILSAPSPMMGATDDAPSHVYFHAVAVGVNGHLRLLPPERIENPGIKPRSAG